MTRSDALRVHFDGTPFVLHRQSGISRYFAELIAAFDREPGLGVAPVTPYRWVANIHAPVAEQRGFHPIPLPRSRRAQVLGALNRRFDDTPEVDLVHFGLYSPETLARARERPSVTTVYDFTFERFPGLFGDQSPALATKRAYLEACDALLCISETTRRDLREFHPELDKPVAVTPLAVSDAFASGPPARVRGLPARYVLNVGNRVEHKNAELVFRAFKHVASQSPGLRLVLTGAALADEKARLAELDILHLTHVLTVSDAQLPTLYRNAAAFLFPSRYEGFGLPLVEAMAAGCPVVISDAPALVEVAGGAADVVGPDDVEGAAAALLRLVDDRAHAARQVAAGRLRAADFTWQRTARASAAAYRQALREL